MAETIGGKKAFVATCPRLDPEMIERISRHQKERTLKGWETFEEERELWNVFPRLGAFQGIVVDCVTLWINNLLFALGDERVLEKGEAATEMALQKTLESLTPLKSQVIFVTNEVGMGIVPENALARLFRDISGRFNQKLAEHASEVLLMNCGLPLKIK